MTPITLATLATAFAPPRLYTPTTVEVSALPTPTVANPDHSVANAGSIFYPVDFGADPTGVNDSTKALQAAVDAAFAVVMPDRWSHASKPVRNTVVHLGGGTYRTSGTIWLGTGLTFRLCCGGLFAGGDFAADAFMVSGGPGLEGVSITDVSFDLMRKGQGAIHFDNTLRVHLDRLFVHHYTAYGIKVEQGHEVHVSNCWCGEWGWSESPHNGPGQNLTGVAIEIDGQDHWLSDIIVFSGLRGVVLQGGASVLTNTHIYNGGNESSLEVSGHSVRVLGCYFDFNRVVLVAPIVAVDVSHSFFLGGVGVELRSSGPGGVVDGLTMVGNQFVIGNAQHGDAPADTVFATVTRNESAGAFGPPRGGSVIRDSATPLATYGEFLNHSFVARETTATKALTQRGATRWELDFSDALAFATGIARVQFGFEVVEGGGFPVAVARPRRPEAPMVVVVETSEPVNGTLVVTAYQ